MANDKLSSAWIRRNAPPRAPPRVKIEEYADVVELVDARLTADVTLSWCEGFLGVDKCSEKQKKIRQSTKIDCRKIVVRAWGFEPQRIAAQEPKGDVTLVNFYAFITLFANSRCMDICPCAKITKEM